LAQVKKTGSLWARQRTDHGAVRFAEELDAGGAESDGFDLGAQAEIESMGKDVGKVVVPLQNIKARTAGAGDDLIIRVENRRDNGAKLAQPGEQFLFEFGRLRGEVLDAETRTLTPAACKAWAQLRPERPAPIIATGAGFFTVVTLNICVLGAITIVVGTFSGGFPVDFCG
jgi:hypothetical protein